MGNIWLSTFLIEIDSESLQVPGATGKATYCECNPPDQPFILCGMKSDLYEEALEQDPSNISPVFSAHN